MTQDNSSMHKTTLGEWALMALLVILWGSAYALNDLAVKAYSAIWVVSMRLCVGAVALGAAVIIMRLKLPPLKDWRSWASMIAAGVVGSLLPFYLIAQAQTEVPQALASIYLSATPLCVAVLAHFLIPNEKITGLSIIGVLLGIVGVVILVYPSMSDIAGARIPILPQLYLIGGALCYGATLIIIRLTSPQIHPIALSFGFVFCSAVASIPFAINSAAPIIANSGIAPMLAMIALGLGPTALASILYVGAVHKVGPVLVANISNLVPFWAIFVSFALFGQEISINAIVALLVILFGVYLVQHKRS